MFGFTIKINIKATYNVLTYNKIKLLFSQKKITQTSILSKLIKNHFLLKKISIIYVIHKIKKKQNHYQIITTS
jgi:hypothetical protein